MNICNLLMNIKCFIFNNFESIIDICSIVVTIWIAHRVEIYTGKQDEKILEDNKMQRIANFYSNVILSDKPLIIRFNEDNLENIEYMFVNIFDAKIAKKDNIRIDMYLKSISQIIPTQIKVTEIRIWNSEKNESGINKQLISKNNKNNNYESVGVINDTEIMISFLIGLNENEIEIIKKWISKNENINIQINISCKNQFNIITDCELYGMYKSKAIYDITDCNIIDLKKRYLKIIKTEEDNNE